MLVTSHFGRVLVAIRENEDRARFLGYNVQRYKMAVCMISALLTGLGGALYPGRSAFATPDLHAVDGVGRVHHHGHDRRPRHPRRPRSSAARSSSLLQDKVSSYVDWYFIVIGLVLIVIVLFMPKGLLGFRRLLGVPPWRTTA